MKNEKELKNQILLTLQSLGYNLGHLGTLYLTQTIIEVIKLGDSSDYFLERDVYPIISKKHNKSISNIKSSIHKATSYAYIMQKGNAIKKFFHFCDNTKPTTKEIVITMINFLRRNNLCKF